MSESAKCQYIEADTRPCGDPAVNWKYNEHVADYRCQKHLMKPPNKATKFALNWSALEGLLLGQDVQISHDPVVVLEADFTLEELFNKKAIVVPMILHCPECAERHVDQPPFADKPHHTHACQHCGFVWRPAIVPTVGVQFLPGFKDGEP